MMKNQAKDSRRPKDVRGRPRMSDGATFSEVLWPLHCPLCARPFVMRVIADGPYGVYFELIAAHGVTRDGVIASVTHHAPDTLDVSGGVIAPVSDAFPSERGFDDDEAPTPPETPVGLRGQSTDDR